MKRKKSKSTKGAKSIYIENQAPAWLKRWYEKIKKSKFNGFKKGLIYNIYECGNIDTCILPYDEDEKRPQRRKLYTTPGGNSGMRVVCDCKEKSPLLVKFKLCAICGMPSFGKRLVANCKCVHCRHSTKYKNIKTRVLPPRKKVFQQKFVDPYLCEKNGPGDYEINSVRAKEEKHTGIKKNKFTLTFEKPIKWYYRVLSDSTRPPEEFMDYIESVNDLSGGERWDCVLRNDCLRFSQIHQDRNTNQYSAFYRRLGCRNCKFYKSFKEF